MSTRRSGPYAFDHGAQYFTVRDSRFKEQVERWKSSGIVEQWAGRIRVLRDGEPERENHRHCRYVGVPGMSAVTHHLAAGLDVSYRVQVSKIRRSGNAIILEDANSVLPGRYDTLVATAPPAQSSRLLTHFTPLADRLSNLQMSPCWAVMLVFKSPMMLPYDGVFIQDADIAWGARNSSKPGRPGYECWVLHAGDEWSSANFERKPEEVIDHLTTVFFAAVGSEVKKPSFSAAHRWRYARAVTPLSDGCLWDREAQIGVCGDWCCGSRIEGAFLSGALMAQKLLKG